VLEDALKSAPLYRQSQILARQDVRIERSTLAQWVGAASAAAAA
jgi:transposase